MSASHAAEVQQLFNRWRELHPLICDAANAAEAHRQLRRQAHLQQESAILSGIERQLTAEPQAPTAAARLQQVRQFWQQQAEAIAARHVKWKTVMDGVHALHTRINEMDIGKQLSAIIALCTLGSACIVCLTALGPQDSSATVLRAEICQLAEAAGSKMLELLPLLSLDALKSESDALKQEPSITCEAHLALRLIEIGLPADCALGNSFLAANLNFNVLGELVDLRAELLLLPFGLDPSDAPLDDPQKESSISIARRIATSAEC